MICHESMTDDEKPGIEIVMPVNINDISEFQNKAIEFFRYWKIRPEIKGGDIGKIQSLIDELEIKPIFSEDDWELRPAVNYYNNQIGIAVMGNVSYPINWDLVERKMNFDSYDDNRRILFDFIRSNKFILRFNISDLDFSASRESLEYTDKTYRVIIDKIKKILDNIFKIIDNKIQSSESYWAAMIVYNQIFSNGEEKLFHGDIHRLESYYQNKFSWNGINVNSGSFKNIEKWDRILGHSNVENHGSNPVLTIYANKSGKIKCLRTTNHGNNRIPASSKTCVVIHDLETPILTKASIRYLFQKYNHTKIYFLRFHNFDQKKEFFDQMHFDSVPVIYVSQIKNDVKKWLKDRRVANNGTLVVRDKQYVRAIVPANRLNEFKLKRWDICSFYKNKIDIYEEKGFYVELEKDLPKINGLIVHNLAELSHYSNILFECIGEIPKAIYAFPKKNYDAKWFSDAVKKKQWIKLESYFKDKEDVILHGKGLMVSKASSYYRTNENSKQRINITFANKILPLLTNKGGTMYKVCTEISKDFEKMLDLGNALAFFNIKLDLPNDHGMDFASLFNNVFTAYPLLSRLGNNECMYSNDNCYKIESDFLNHLAEYINLIDFQKNQN